MQPHFSRLWRCFLLCLLLVAVHRAAPAASLADIPQPVSDAAVRLVQYCTDPKTGLDEQAVAAIVNYVLSPKNSREFALPDAHQAPGAYYEFDLKIDFPQFMAYSYTSLVPANITRPSSLRYSVWSAPQPDMHKLPNNWPMVPADGTPVVIRGMQHDSDTPDLSTGVYHEYDLKRTLILLNYRGRQVFISISKQVDQSGVGKKGLILGNDTDWTYFYSNEPGTMKTALGWVKSYIYDYFSVGVYIDSPTSPRTVRSGAFQWLRAGWLGMNFVKPVHILQGLRRFSGSSRTVLESPRVPSPAQLYSVYQSFSAMPASTLAAEYSALQQSVRSMAVQSGRIGESRSGKKQVATESKEQIVQELMLEYLKKTLGKPTILQKESPVFSHPGSP